MNCSRAQQALSARMDGEHVPAAGAAEAHAATCDACGAFVRQAEAVRTAVRIREAERVPDLTGPIMDAIGAEVLRPRPTRSRPGAHRPRRARARTLVAAAVAGTLVGSLLVGGPWRGAGDGPVALADVVRGIRAAAPSLQAFAATFRIREHGLSPEIPERELSMRVAYLAPQRFRLEVDDLTSYPSAAWTPTDLLYIEDMPATYRSGPTGCPAELGPGVCPTTRETVSRTSRYSAASPLPADLILPIATFGSAEGVTVTGHETVGDDRDAVRLEMTFRRAAPLFPFLRLGGTWRPFFDHDRVVLWLDAQTWFPLRSVVTPSTDPARREWELRFGRQVEAPEQPILEVDTVSIDDVAPRASAFAIPGDPEPSRLTLDDATSILGYRPATPTALGGLRLTDVVVPSGGGPTPSSVLVYANGMDYLRVAEHPSWDGDGPFGGLALSAEQVRLAGGSIGYYEPASADVGRSLRVHTPATELLLETNLSRERLLEVASSVPLQGVSFPAGWETSGAGGVTLRRIPVARALTRAHVPAGALTRTGYVIASAQLERRNGSAVGLTFHLHHRDLDAAGAPLTFHVELDAAIPFAATSARFRVSLAGRPARWSPVGGVLEWAHGSDVRSLQGSSSLAELMTVAESLEGAGP